MLEEMADDVPSQSFVGLVVSEQCDEEEDVSLLDTIGGTEFANSTEQLLNDIEADELGPEQFADTRHTETKRAFDRNGDKPKQRNHDRLPLYRKKKIKNRHVKAAVMIAIIWTIMVAFLVVALSVDWWYKGSIDLPDLCTLCHNNSLEMDEMQLTEWPTRKPSSSAGSSSLFTILGKEKTLRPPPENIAEVCSPSIYLDNGVDYFGPSKKDLLAICANACFPGYNQSANLNSLYHISYYLTPFLSTQAMCCVIEDEEAKLGLMKTLQSQGLGPQAAIFLSSIENCYTDDNIATCDAYGQWCQTLYRLDDILDDTISKEMEASCTPSLGNSTTSPRALLPEQLREDCSICNNIACCYDNSTTSSIAFQRKRKRQHYTPFDAFAKDDGDSRNLFSVEICDSFYAEDGSLNAKICDAYGPYCNPLHSMQSSISIPSLTRPTTTSTNSTFISNTFDSNSSYVPTMALPSYYPTVSIQPSLYKNIPESNAAQSTTVPSIGNQSLVPSTASSSTTLPTPDLSNQNNVSLAPSPSGTSQSPTVNTNVNSTQTSSPSYSVSLATSPSGTSQSPTTNTNVNPTQTSSSDSLENESLGPEIALSPNPIISTSLDDTSSVTPSSVFVNVSLAPSTSATQSSETPTRSIGSKATSSSAPSTLSPKNESMPPSMHPSLSKDTTD